jgi:succinyl-diaminopimelate desuccinylase
VNDLVDTLRDRLTARRAEQFRLLSELLRVRSDNPPGEGAASAVLAEETLRNLGLETTRHDPPPDLMETMGLISAPSIVARYANGDGPRLALVAGLDTRPAPPGKEVEAYSGSIVDGVITGQGARNGTSSACAMIYGALGAIETTNIAGTIDIVLTHDRESGGYLGTKWLLDDDRIAPDLAVVAGHGEAVVTHHPGMIHFQIDLSVDRKRADPKTDAMRAAHAVLGALFEADGRLARTTSPVQGVGAPGVIVGALESGSRADEAPMEAQIWVGRRYLPSEDLTTVRRAMSAVVGKALSGLRGIQCKVRPVLTDAALSAVDDTRPLVAAFLKAAQDGPGRRLAARGWNRPTEARFFAERNIPAVVFGCGPAFDPRTADEVETLALDHLRSSTEIFALALSGLMGAAPVEAA